MTAVEYGGRVYTFGRRPDAAARHDPRSRAFPARTVPLRTIAHRAGPVLDQGDVGSCTGHAAVAALNCRPPRRWWNRTLTHTDAVALYTTATRLDGFPGEYPPDDTGSDGLSAAKAATTRGWARSYTHCFGLDHVLGALSAGPLIVGTGWREGMLDPGPGGFVHAVGPDVGGHEWCLTGIDVDRRLVRGQNSWGTGWGSGGFFTMTWDDLDVILSDGGDATVLNR